MIAARATMLEVRARSSRHRVGAALVFHALAEQAGSPASELVPALSIRAFERLVVYLARHYRIVAASGLMSCICSRSAGERLPLALTFDDDLSSHRDLALPVLQRHGLPATFFVGGSWTSSGRSPWWRSLQQIINAGIRPQSVSPLLAAVPGRQRWDIHRWAAYVTAMSPTNRRCTEADLALTAGSVTGGMSAHDLDVLSSAGMEIGFHTRAHDPLIQLTDPELRAALNAGDEIAAPRPTAISYPHGHADARVANAARAAGFTVGFTTTATTISGDDDPLLLGRLAPLPCRTPSFTDSLARALAHRRH